MFCVDKLLLPILKTFAQCPRSLHTARNAWNFQPVCSSRTVTLSCSQQSPRTAPETFIQHGSHLVYLWFVLFPSVPEVTGYTDRSSSFFLSFSHSFFPSLFSFLNISLSCGCNMTLFFFFPLTLLPAFHSILCSSGSH